MIEDLCRIDNDAKYLPLVGIWKDMKKAFFKIISFN